MQRESSASAWGLTGMISSGASGERNETKTCTFLFFRPFSACNTFCSSNWACASCSSAHNMQEHLHQKMEHNRSTRNGFLKAPETYNTDRNPNSEPDRHAFPFITPITTGTTPSSSAGGTLRQDAVVRQRARLALAAAGELRAASACTRVYKRVRHATVRTCGMSICRCTCKSGCGVHAYVAMHDGIFETSSTTHTHTKRSRP